MANTNIRRRSCARDPMKRIRECVYSDELDLPTLIWAQGREFPLAYSETRLKCPACGSRRVRPAFVVPGEPLTEAMHARRLR